jgi:hypothetical protein
MSQSSQRKGWLFARSEALAAAHRAMNALAPSEDMARRIKRALVRLQAIRSTPLHTPGRCILLQGRLSSRPVQATFP